MTNATTPSTDLHPFLAAMVEKRRSGPQYKDITAEEVRQLGRIRQGEPTRLPEVFLVKELQFVGPAGPVPLRLYKPADSTSAPLIVYFHGGGFVAGDLDSHDSILRRLVNASGAIILSVDYRLAPEHPFPAGVEDAEAALNYASEHAHAFGADPNVIIAAGDSAGGALALAASSAASDLAGLVLFYPVTDLTRIGQTESYRQFGDGSVGLSQDDMNWMAGQYAPDSATRSDWRCSPLYASENIQFPPTFIVTAEYDVLRSEGEAFAQLLAERGVPCEHHQVRGVNHGFLGAGDAVPQAGSTIHATATWVSLLTASRQAQ